MIIIEAVVLAIGLFVIVAVCAATDAATGVIDVIIFFKEYLPFGAAGKWSWGVSLLLLLVVICYRCISAAIAKKPRGWIP